jgi:hypothetical protein
MNDQEHLMSVCNEFYSSFLSADLKARTEGRVCDDCGKTCLEHTYYPSKTCGFYSNLKEAVSTFARQLGLTDQEETALLRELQAKGK